MGADRDDGLVLKGQVEEVSHFLQGRRAVRNDKAGELGPFGGEPMDDDGELQPFKRADGGAPTLRKGTGITSATVAISG